MSKATTSRTTSMQCGVYAKEVSGSVDPTMRRSEQVLEKGN